MKIIIIINFIFLTSFGYSQLKKVQFIETSSTESLFVEYVIGIANEDVYVYSEVLEFLKDCKNVEIYASCEQQKIIGVKVNIKDFKSFDVFEIFLKRNYYGLIVSLKNDDIFSKDCKEEIIKQNNL